MEREYEVRTIMVVLECGGVCDGEMLPTGYVNLLNHPAEYPHKCNKCGRGQTSYGKEYPFIKHERITRDKCVDGSLCNDEADCDAYSDAAFACARPTGHEGSHVSCGDVSHNIAVWDDDNKT